jgi:hypothetical protein
VSKGTISSRPTTARNAITTVSMSASPISAISHAEQPADQIVVVSVEARAFQKPLLFIGGSARLGPQHFPSVVTGGADNGSPQRSLGCNPVCLAMRVSILGPISS